MQTRIRRPLQQAVKVVIVLGRVRRHRRMEEKPLADVDPAEELPIALQVRMHGAVGGARRKAIERIMELARAEHRQHHELVEIRSAALDPELATDGGVAPVATHDIVRLQGLPSAAVDLDNCDARAAVVLFDRLRRPPEPALDIGKSRHPRAQDTFGDVLGQPFVVLGIVGIDDLPERRRVPELAHQVAVRGDTVHGKFGRQEARGAQLVRDAPGIEVLHRALRQPLPFWNPLRLDAAFHNGAR